MKKILVAILLLIGGGGAYLSFQTYHPYRGYHGSVVVNIPPGSGAASAARTLSAHGVIEGRAPFLMLYAIGRFRHRTLKAGEYLFDHPLSVRSVYDKIVRGEVYYHLVVIPEGSDRFDIARILHEKLGLDPREVLLATAQPGAIRDLDPAAPSLEGYLFPDTYRFPASTTPARAAEVMVARFRQVLDSRFRQGLSVEPNENLHDVLTLASLVEKETPNPDERAEIAGVFTRRLQHHMTLDCDPTVVYAARLAVAGTDPSPIGPAPITAGELALNSPYNTYHRAGLPPGPICNPGAASIKAALHPAGGDALYFVSNLHEGHVFASTLAEHNRNVARYRREVAAENGTTAQSKPAPPDKQSSHSKQHRTRRRIVK
ncbi:MAG TPA: endolytic transglycosylase MltG [Terriglobia bacterium]|nr:endolytic transglycosylase MltG [Terriglobia bacterium]